MYDINHLKVILDDDLCSQLLFIHTTGCNTTSGFCGVGKESAFQNAILLYLLKLIRSPKSDQGRH